ncbi:MAG: hypothetical protein S4CHLAM81_14810 [Chlamydiales bacterium]|nr:hypothetical protein [Chlamydiales bacterium]MCH9636250.1 hypothetical protein [Chlamydiales bacterium]MCH9703302.1 hypothetical protein [Chlamydiota bacterium]
MAIAEEFKQDLGLVVEAGLIAIKQGDEESAKKLFDAADILDPGTVSATMGHGLIALHKMDIPGARKYFNTVLETDKENHRAKAFLAFANVLSCLQDGSEEEKIKGLQEGAALASEVLEKCKEPSTRELAQSLLDWEKELQKGE